MRLHWRSAWLGVVLMGQWPVPLGAQGGSVRGRVVDETGRPVPFAQIEVAPTGRRLVTDGSGDFTISALVDGDYELRIRRIGYQPVTVALRMPEQSGSLTIRMATIPRLLDSVRIRERRSTFRFTGIVLDDADQPVVDAQVIAAGASDLGVRTDSAGHFRLLKPQKGAVVLRVRKVGYSPYFGSLRLMAEREDTLRMRRLAHDLPEAYILAESGFGRDTFAYTELDERMRWNRSTGVVASREDLDPWADMDLCQALMRTAAAGRMQLRESECSEVRCVIIDGLRPLLRPLNAFMAAEVEAFEFYERDQTATLSHRIGLMCNRRALGGSRQGGGIVIWLRRKP